MRGGDRVRSKDTIIDDLGPGRIRGQGLDRALVRDIQLGRLVRCTLLTRGMDTKDLRRITIAIAMGTAQATGTLADTDILLPVLPIHQAINPPRIAILLPPELLSLRDPRTCTPNLDKRIIKLNHNHKLWTS